MANRACPLCFVRVTWFEVLSQSEHLQCSACRVPLELSRGTRIFGSFLGFTAAFLALNEIPSTVLKIHWVLDPIIAIGSFAMFSALAVLIHSDLIVRPPSSNHTFPHPRE